MYQIDRPPVRPAWSGSLGSLVALELVPEKTVDTPLINEIGSRLVKLSREGGEPGTEILTCAISLVTAPALLATTTVSLPPSVTVMLLRTSVALVAPSLFAPVRPILSPLVLQADPGRCHTERNIDAERDVGALRLQTDDRKIHHGQRRHKARC